MSFDSDGWNRTTGLRRGRRVVRDRRQEDREHGARPDRLLSNRRDGRRGHGLRRAERVDRHPGGL